MVPLSIKIDTCPVITNELIDWIKMSKGFAMQVDKCTDAARLSVSLGTYMYTKNQVEERWLMSKL
jgi:hypothetical protein